MIYRLNDVLFSKIIVKSKTSIFFKKEHISEYF